MINGVECHPTSRGATLLRADARHFTSVMPSWHMQELLIFTSDFAQTCSNSRLVRRCLLGFAEGRGGSGRGRRGSSRCPGGA